MSFSDNTNVSHLSNLSLIDMNNADYLSFEKRSTDDSKWDYDALVVGSNDYALLHDTYKFSAIKGATYVSHPGRLHR